MLYGLLDLADLLRCQGIKLLLLLRAESEMLSDQGADVRLRSPFHALRAAGYSPGPCGLDERIDILFSEQGLPLLRDNGESCANASNTAEARSGQHRQRRFTEKRSTINFAQPPAGHMSPPANREKGCVTAWERFADIGASAISASP